MAKSQNAQKNVKKEPLKTAQEKKEAKREKKAGKNQNNIYHLHLFKSHSFYYTRGFYFIMTKLFANQIAGIKIALYVCKKIRTLVS